jgi:hypothetical protein
MERRQFVNQVGTLALFSLSPLAAVQAMQFPKRAKDDRRPLSKPRYAGAVSNLQVCVTGYFACGPGIDGVCGPGNVRCVDGRVC